MFVTLLHLIHITMLVVLTVVMEDMALIKLSILLKGECDLFI